MKKPSALSVASSIIHLAGVVVVSSFQTLAPSLGSFSRKYNAPLLEDELPLWLVSDSGVTRRKEVSGSAFDTKLYSSRGRRGGKEWRVEDDVFLDDEQYGAFGGREKDRTFFDDAFNEEEEDDGFESTEGLAQWESCEYGNARVLFPQKSFSKNDDDDEEKPSLPKAIIHFIGGTGFGSLPQFAYGHLLEEISSKGNYVIVSTPPLSSLEELSSPLDHFRIAYEMARNFRIAYRSLLEDEYGVTAAQSIPIVGMGHSLGSRIHVVCATQSKFRRLAFPRAGNILLSFNNFYATRSIPFLYEVGMLSKQAAQGLLQRKELQDLKGNISKPKSWMSSTGDDTRSSPRNRRGVNRNESQSTRSKRRRDVLDGIENEIDSLDGDDDIDELSFTSRSASRQRRRRSRYNDRNINFEQGLREQAKRGVEWATDTLTSQLDRLSTSLEFSPSPEELVDMVSQGKYGVPKSLLVQFDLDDIDQSVLLAKAILGGNGSSRAAATNEENSITINDCDAEGDEYDVDLQFARLKGNHLTPIFKGRRAKAQREKFQNQFETEDSGTKQYEDVSDLMDLVSTITTYIEQVILKQQSQSKTKL